MSSHAFYTFASLLVPCAIVACSSPVDGDALDDSSSDLIVRSEQERLQLDEQFRATEDALFGQVVTFEQNIELAAWRGTPNLTEGAAVCHLRYTGAVLNGGTYEEKGAKLLFAAHGYYKTLDQDELDRDARGFGEALAPEERGGAHELHFRLAESGPATPYCAYSTYDGVSVSHQTRDDKDHCLAPLEIVCVAPPGADMRSAVTTALASTKIITTSK